MTLIWTIVLVAAIVAEAITVDLVSIWFSVGAIVALVSDVFFKATEAIQITLFIILSLSCII